MSEKTPAQRLREILKKSFADSKIEPSERQEMIAIFREAKITVPEVRATFLAFLESELHDALADGKVTDEERNKLKTIVAELKLPEAMVPDEVKRLL